MQSVAVISDIHANLPALEAVLEEIDGLGIEHILCCGDIVGYGPQPVYIGFDDSMSDLQPVTIVEQVAPHLREGIRQGRWRDEMPGRDVLARDLGVSRPAHRS